MPNMTVMVWTIVQQIPPSGQSVLPASLIVGMAMGLALVNRTLEGVM